MGHSTYEPVSWGECRSAGYQHLSDARGACPRHDRQDPDQDSGAATV
jgi:hypothetical protein